MKRLSLKLRSPSKCGPCPPRRESTEYENRLKYRSPPQPPPPRLNILKLKLKSELIDFGLQYVNVPKNNLEKNENIIIKERKDIFNKKINIILKNTIYNYVKIVKVDTSDRLHIITVEVNKKEYHNEITKIKKQTGGGRKSKKLKKKREYVVKSGRACIKKNVRRL